MTTPIRQLLIRNEDFLLKRHLMPLIKRLIDPALKDFNFERLTACVEGDRGSKDSSDVTAGELCEKLLTPPMMAEFRTIVVDDFHKYGKDELEVLLQVLSRTDLPSHVILVADSVDRRTVFYKAFQKIGEVFEFKKPYANQVPAFVGEEARRLGLKLESGAAELLADVAGTDLNTLVSELDKLTLYAHPETFITKAHVRAAVAQGLVDNIFAFSNLVGRRDLHGAVGLFRRMTAEGEAEIKILYLVIGHFRKLMLASEAKASGRGGELAEILKISPYFVKDYEAQIKQFSLSQLTHLYKRLMQLSEDLRSSGPSKPTLFENFLIDACAA